VDPDDGAGDGTETEALSRTHLVLEVPECPAVLQGVLHALWDPFSLYQKPNTLKKRPQNISRDQRIISGKSNFHLPELRCARTFCKHTKPETIEGNYTTDPHY